MSTSPDTAYIASIMKAANLATPAAVPTPVLSQSEEIAELKRHNKTLKAERDATAKRASERCTNMMHANRRAERTEHALAKVEEERLDDQLKAVRLYNCFKERIAKLEFDLVQAQQFEHSNAQLREAESVIARLQGELAQHREAAAREHTSKSSMLEKMQVKYETDKQNFKKQSEKEFQKRLAEREKQLKEGFTRQSAAAMQKWKQEHQSAQQDNKRLEQRLQQSQMAVEWYKNPVQQQSSQSVGGQGQPLAAGVFAGFPQANQQGPEQVRGQVSKRRRLNSMG